MQTVSRLYSKFQPKSYSLAYDFTKIFDDSTFSGQVTISGHKPQTGSLTLHAKDLSITSASINGTAIEQFDVSDDEVSLNTDQIGDIEVKISFNGVASSAMHGIYPCFYQQDGETKQLIGTQFESHHAREAFPCIDEPEAKSTFDITLKTIPGITVLSNMPVQSQSEESEQLQTSFQTTPIMSTYLVAFSFGDLQRVSTKTKNGTDVNIYATNAHSQTSLQFALKTAQKSIEFFEDYFGVAYPLPKSDHLALPDFSSGAMENWGLITYRESCLIIDENSAVSSKEVVATVIAHEVSHQWFGNLVTMKWWNDLWLNESFANLMEYVAIDALYPDWNIWNIYASSESIAALRRDQLAGVQPVKTDVNHPDEISTLFDPAIVYAKGGRLLKMLRAYIGEEAWRAGLSAYFTKHAYGNTAGSDLWQALSEASEKDVGGFMDRWLTQSGFPVVELTTTDAGYQLRQERFVVGQATDDQLWPIPLASDDTVFPERFDERQITVKDHVALPLLNRGNVGHFMVNYDSRALKSIVDAVWSGELPTIDRLAFLHEQSLLAHTPRSSTATLLPLLDAYSAEQEEPVWDIMATVIGDIKRFVENDEQDENLLKKRITKLTLPLYKSLGAKPQPDESSETAKLRAIIASLLSYADHQPLIDSYLDEFHSSKQLELIDGELRPIVYAVASKHGSEEDFERLTDIHQTTTNPELRDDILAGLCAARLPERIEQLLGRLADNTKVKPQDLTRWYVSLLRNRYAREQTWQWLETHWQWIVDTFKGDKSYDDIARYSAAVLSGDKWLDRYRTFFEPKMSDPALKRTIEIGLTDITARTEWIAEDMLAVKQALRQ